MELRDYQIKIIEALKNSLTKNKRVVLCSATGSGKTTMFTYMVKKHIEKGGRALIFTHRKELLNQADNSFKRFDLKPELIKANSKPDLSKNLHISMVETFYKRIEDYQLFLNTRSLIIIDEAHLNSFNKIFEYINKETFVIGATATPFRKGKKTPELKQFYSDLIQLIDTPELIQKGYLSHAKSFGVKIDLKKAKKIGDDYDVSSIYNQNQMWHGVLKNWIKLTENTKTLLFSSNVEQSKKVCDEFNAQGYLAKHIDAKTPSKERENILEWFAKNDNAILCNCGILNAGFDQPDIKTIILYRATTSLPLFLQMCGRGSRITEKKNSFNILDFGNNIQRLGFWENARIWSLENEKTKSKKEGVPSIKYCENCGAINYARVTECVECETPFEKKNDFEKKIAELKLLNKSESIDFAQNKSNIILAKMCKEKLISPFWVLHNKNDINDAREFCRLMGYKRGFEFHNKNRFKVFQS